MPAARLAGPDGGRVAGAAPHLTGLLLLTTLPFPPLPVQTFILADFCWYYVKSYAEGTGVIHLPAGIV